jgi:hypothetical protein
MTIGQTVWVAQPICHSITEPRGVVHEGTVIAIGDRGEVVVKDVHGIRTYGGLFSDAKAFESAGEAWSHCAAVLLVRAGEIVAAANKCEAKATEAA